MSVSKTSRTDHSRSGAARRALAATCLTGAALLACAGLAEARKPNATAKPRPKPTPAMVDFAAGCITVGPARPYHVLVAREVCLPAFRLDRAEVTVAQYAQCVAAGRCKPAPSDDKLCNANRLGREQHPANCVAYADAVGYCKWRGARLPAPDEWERAARGPKMTTYPWGEARPTPKLAVHPLLAGGDAHDHEATTSPVCSLPKGNSPEGLCDLAGNVAEWVAGYWADSKLLPTITGDALGPFGPGVPTDGGRMTRGGSFGAGLDNLRGWARQRVPADEAPSIRNGLRCAAD